MALKKFIFHGAFKTKNAAKRREKSEECGGKCFVLKRKVKTRGRRAKRTRFFVLEPR